MLEGEGGAQLELSSLSQEQAANYTCAAVNTAGLGEAEAFQLEIYGMSMEQITIKTPNRKCRLYWCLIGFIVWRYSQSCWYFRPLLLTSASEAQPLFFSKIEFRVLVQKN